jgi:catechol-2,3-dioxygenase
MSVAKQLNHATLFVRDVQASRVFYQNLFGMPILTRQPPGSTWRPGAASLGYVRRPRANSSALIISVLVLNASMRSQRMRNLRHWVLSR